MSAIKKKLLYLEAYDKILKMLADYRKGDMLPGRSELMKITGVSQRPVQQAVDMLVREGVLSSVKGQGCFLREALRKIEVPETGQFNQLEYPVSHATVKKLRFGIMSAEWNVFRSIWESIYEKYQATHLDIGVEFVPYAPESTSQEDIKNFDILQVSADSLPRFAEDGYFFDMNELDRERECGFYTCFNDTIAWNGKRLGYPHVAAVNCYFWNKKFLEDSTSLSQSGSGFWNFLKALSLAVKGKPVSALINTFPIEDLFRSADSSVSWTVDAKSIMPSEGFKCFLQHFEEYYCNNKVFYNECLNPLDIRDSFFNGKGLAISGNSCWIPDMASQKSLKFGILPPGIEPSCHVQVNCIVNAISNYTSYPEECLEFIQYLSSQESLTFFAENGRLTSRKDSNMNLKFKSLDIQSVENLKCCLENGKVLKVMNPELRYNLFATVYHELRKWQHGVYSAEEVFEILKRKINFYIRGMMIKKEGQDRK